MSGRTARIVVFVLRGLALILIIVAAAKPVVVRPDPGAPARWAVLLDSSGSMRVRDPQRRLDAGKKIMASISKTWPHAATFEFADSVSTVDPAALARLEPHGRGTDLSEAIDKTLSGNAYKGEVIITDGREVGAGDAVTQAAA